MVPGDELQLVSQSGRNLFRLFVAGVLCLHTVFFLGLLNRIERGYPDFIGFYTAATIFRDGLGHQLYVGHVQNEIQKQITGRLPSRIGPLPYIHPPFEALIFLPLSRLPYRQAFLVWDVLNLAMLIFIVMLLRNRLTALHSVPIWEVLLSALAFFPVFECLLQGQDSILQLLFCVLAWKSLKEGSGVLAGCWFALGSFKFQLMLPIILLFVLWNGLWKRRLVLIGFGAVSLVLVAICLGLVGWRGLLSYPAFAVQIAGAPSLGGVPADFLPNLHGLIMGWPLHLTGAAGVAVTLFLSAGLFVFAAMKGTSARSDEMPLQFSMAIAVSELIAWQTNIHDFTLLVLPLALMADYCLHTPPRRAKKKFSLLYPTIPLLISPIWLVLWLTIGDVNLLAIPLQWWIWKLGKEWSRPGFGKGT